MARPPEEAVDAAKTKNILRMAQLEEAGNVEKGTTEQVANVIDDESNIEHAIEYMRHDEEWLKKMKRKVKAQRLIIKEHLKKIEK